MNLFDYSEKSTEWLHTLRAKLGIFHEELRAKVQASIDAELKKR
jgi:hypothetical protein